uniref:Uncharacterized protein n=1 Tax=Tanacetum cinerariifolium TaxID=118510 RepID=A0A6L2LUY0_TANCI|nr:hypothetical protein [Tanacetum cinerariifolium]
MEATSLTMSRRMMLTYDKLHSQSYVALLKHYGCLKGGSGNNGGKRLAIAMVEEAWLSEKKELALKYKFERFHVSNTSCRPSTIHPRDLDDPHDDAHPEGDNDAISESEDDDELPTEKVSQELVDEMSQTVDEAKLCKVVNEMLRQRCTLGDEHQYHIDQMQNFLKNGIIWERREEFLVSPYPQRPIIVVQSCQEILKLMHYL